MHIIDTRLKQREAEGDLIQVGVLGAGEMTLGLVNQIERHIPGMRIAAIYNRTPSKAVRCYVTAGKEEGAIVHAAAAQDIDGAIADNKPCLAATPELLWQSSKIDCVAEMTGTLTEAFQWICDALRASKKVCSFNAELDATMGPYLQELAASHGTRYTLGDGDQPGVTLNLYRQVQLMGFTPLVCGNIKGFLNNHRTPEDQRGFAELYGLSVNMVTSFTDGTKVALEQASIANATGMKVAKRGMLTLQHDGHIDELVNKYDVEEIKKLGGIVEMVVGAKPGPGVFVFATADDPVSKRFLKYGKLGDGPLYSFYVPYHLLFFELPFSIARLVDYEDGTLDAMTTATQVDKRESGPMSVECVALAKRDLKAGEVLDGMGGFCHYGLCENSSTVQSERLLPAGLCEGKVLLHDVPKDTPITWNDVACDADNVSTLDAAYFSMCAEAATPSSSPETVPSDEEQTSPFAKKQKVVSPTSSPETTMNAVSPTSVAKVVQQHPTKESPAIVDDMLCTNLQAS